MCENRWIKLNVPIDLELYSISINLELKIKSNWIKLDRYSMFILASFKSEY